MENEIVHTALENLHRIAGVQAFWREKGPLNGMLEVTVNGLKHTFIVDVKRELRAHQLDQVEHYFRHHKHFLLVAHHLFPKIKGALREKEIPYLEANGNIFLKNEGLYLFIDTPKPLAIEKSKANRAFTKTGLKVLFYLLQHKDAINLTQRELALKTDVGLGNIPQIIEGLKEMGYLIPLNDKTYIWENKKELLDRWANEYATILRPKLKKERFKLKGPWEKIAFVTPKTVWGGEPAADVLTNHLRPEKFIIYTRETRIDLIKNYKLMPDSTGEIEALDMFWKPENKNTAPPILVYVDLLLEGGKRNKETAEKIYNDYIQPNL